MPHLCVNSGDGPLMAEVGELREVLGVQPGILMSADLLSLPTFLFKKIKNKKDKGKQSSYLCS